MAKLQSHINLEVIYATTEKQIIKRVLITAPATVLQVIEASNILTDCPEIDLTQQKVGIFSKIVSLDSFVAAGDRVEIYRPLTMTAMQKRWLRVAKIRKKK